VELCFALWRQKSCQGKRCRRYSALRLAPSRCLLCEVQGSRRSAPSASSHLIQAASVGWTKTARTRLNFLMLLRPRTYAISNRWRTLLATPSQLLSTNFLALANARKSSVSKHRQTAHPGRNNLPTQGFPHVRRDRMAGVQFRRYDLKLRIRIKQH